MMMNVYHNDWIDHYLFDLMMVKMNIPHHDDTEILVKYAMDDFHQYPNDNHHYCNNPEKKKTKNIKFERFSHFLTDNSFVLIDHRIFFHDEDDIHCVHAQYRHASIQREIEHE